MAGEAIKDAEFQEQIKRFETSLKLNACAGFDGLSAPNADRSSREFKEQEIKFNRSYKNLNDAEKCIGVMKDAVSNGAVPEFPSTLLALQGHYRHFMTSSPIEKTLKETPKEEASIRSFSKALTDFAVANSKENGTRGVFWSTQNDGFMKPITYQEFEAAENPYSHAKTPDMNPQRALPVSCSIIAVNAVAHSAINSDLVLRPHKDANGNQITDGNGNLVRMSVQEHAKALRSEIGEAKILNDFALSVNNSSSMTYGDCARAGARLGILLQDETGARYNGKHLVTPPPPPKNQILNR